jgi:hypothetical protein
MLQRILKEIQFITGPKYFGSPIGCGNIVVGGVAPGYGEYCTSDRTGEGSLGGRKRGVV